MYCQVTVAGVVAMALYAPFASAQGLSAPKSGATSLSQLYDPNVHIPHDRFDEQRQADAPTAWQARQLIRWGAVGKCVVARDRIGSLAYIRTDRVSKELAAARQLDQVFTSCLNGSGIVAGGNKAYRRAAVADALNMRLN